LRTENNNISIILVEDNPADVRLIQEAFTDNGTPGIFSVFGDGETAIDYLKKFEPENIHTRPELILLDLNLPGKSGFEVLQVIKTSPALRSVPVVVLTSSNSEVHVNRSYKLSANAFITKPHDYGEFVDMVKMIGDFWLNMVKLPRPSVNFC
jgi:CheY-like chemotaxis protein